MDDSTSETSSSNHENITNEDLLSQRKGKVRIRQPWLHKKNVYKHKVEHGLERTTMRGNIIKAKKFEAQVNCICNKDCAKRIDILHQQQLFESFYQMSTSQKTLYIRGCVQQNSVKKRISDEMPIMSQKLKKTMNVYSLKDENDISQKICMTFFLKCLQVASSTVYCALASQLKNPTAVEKRGKHTPKNKTPVEDRNFVIHFIQKIPAYESHYGRARSSKKYLSSDLSLTKIYREYLRQCDEKQRKKVSKTVFSDIFNKEFNLSFKKPHQDTCKVCDIHRAMNAKEKENNARKMDQHLQEKDTVRQEFINDVQRAKDEGHVKVITFDLQKALPTPKVTTNVAFYKRQLWTYNLCLYDESEKHEASRGGQEIGSCILKHVKNHIGDNVTNLILYSDSCGGQNRNIKVTLLLIHLLTGHQSLRIIDQKFFVSGHSYNSADRCFGLIERAAKKEETISTPQDWMTIIRAARQRNPFEVIKMTSDDFVSSSELESN
uniref:Uncharacterized protein n=1 Tax=Phlebotomus papatasi TaxID=29031 RepID=A0A1B0DBG1_PHLPP